MLCSFKPGPGEHDGTIWHGGCCAVTRISLRRDERTSALSRLETLRWRHSEQLDDQCQLIVLVLSRQQRVSCQKFGQNASQRPHIDWHSVLRSENNFWGSVESGLDIRVDALIIKARWSEVDNLKKDISNSHVEFQYLYSASTLLFQEHIFWFQITMDQPILLKEIQTQEHRISKFSHELKNNWILTGGARKSGYHQWESLELVPLDQLVKVDAEQLKRNALVVTEIEIIEHVNNVMGSVGILSPKVVKDTDFFICLTMESLLITHQF